jgi:phytoene dehydrogenase-like protein
MLPAYRRVILTSSRGRRGWATSEERIVVERTLTPQDIHDRYKVLDGAIYGLASHGKVLERSSPATARGRCATLPRGGSAHPGPGMPMALMSGWIAADTLHQDATSNAPLVACAVTRTPPRPRRTQWRSAILA